MVISAVSYLEFLITALVFYFLGRHHTEPIKNPLPPLIAKLENKKQAVFHPTIEPGIIHRPTAREVFLRQESNKTKEGKAAMKELLDKLNQDKSYES